MGSIPITRSNTHPLAPLERAAGGFFRGAGALRGVLVGVLVLLGLAVPAAVLAGPAPERDIEALRREHWAFRPIARPPVPAVENEGWAASPIDRFILAELEAAGLEPPPRADPRTLLRRAYIDLVGLPPSQAEVNAFLADSSPGAFARTIDALLARPEHGERWGRHWLDVARYADTKGYVDAGERKYAFAYTYRDWVIRALNDDTPYDSFVLEQIAADRLLEAGGETTSLAALGFLTVGQRFNFFPHEIIDDRIDVTARALMGLTLGCARCHDHKYEPLAMTDYYALYGVFASSREPPPDEWPELESARPEAQEDSDFLARLREKGTALRKKREEVHRRIQHEMRAWAGDYLVYLVETLPEHRTRAQPPLRTERGLLREVTAYGRGAVARWRRFIEERGADDPVFGYWNRVVQLARKDFASGAWKALEELRAGGRVNLLLAAALDEARPQAMVEVARAYGRLLEETERLAGEAAAGSGDDAAARASAESASAESARRALEEPARAEILQALRDPRFPGSVSLDESEDLYHLDEHTDVRAHQAEVERVFLGALAPPPRAMVLLDREEPIQAHVFLRGDPERRGEPVARRFPRLLAHVAPEPFGAGSGRLELARAVVARENPLTARVIANRVWAWHFGAGLVRTPSDFGLRSTPPSHPRLLDYLASALLEGEWSLKRLHRLILLSSTWQAASRDHAGAREIDPENRLLWRQNRLPLDFEAMRDTWLSVAGRLEREEGGRPPDSPPDDPAGRRRTVYCQVDRERLPGVFRTFDFPSPDISCPERPETTAPQQTLFLLNSPFLIAQGEALAAWLDREFAPSDTSGRLVALYRRVHARDPAPDETELAERFLAARAAGAASVTEEEALRREAAAAWRHGYGRYDPETRRLASFTVLPHFTGEHWQGGALWPDPELHYLRLGARGGHAGIDSEHAAVRRWTAPFAGLVDVDGELSHGEEVCGDGVEAWIVSSRAGELGHWAVHTARARTRIEGVEVAAGETLDFVVGPRAEHSCDLFEWAPVVRRSPDLGEVEPAAARVLEWSAARDFGGHPPEPSLSPWAEVAQALLASNELLFVD